MIRPSIRIFAPLCASALLLFGFGCKKPFASSNQNLEPIPSPAAQTSDTSTTSTKTIAPANTSPEFEYLRIVFNNFANAKSFRATLSIPSANGQANGRFEFVRREGLHGVLTFPGNLRTELFASGSTILFRANTSTWTVLSGTAEGARIRELFTQALTPRIDGPDGFLPSTAEVKRVIDRTGSCQKFLVTRPNDNETPPTQICVRNHLPSYLITSTKTGPVDIRYEDFDKPLRIVQPK